MSKKRKHRKKKNGSPKKKKINNVQPAQPRSNRRLWIGAGVAALALAGGSLYFLRNNEASTYTSNETSVSRADEIPKISVKELWGKVYNDEGVHLVPEVLNEYSLLKAKKRSVSLPKEERDAFELKLIADSNRDYEIFKKNTIPENYTQALFFKWFATSKINEKLLSLDGVAKTFDLDRKHPLYRELKDNSSDEDGLVGKILTASILITQKKMRHKEMKCDDLETFMRNIEKGEGDCSDFTYAIANNYYTLCAMLERYELSSEIRICLGVLVNKDAKMDLEGHSWIEFYANDRWNKVETTNDKIDENTPISLSTPALYSFKSRTGYIAKFVSTRLFYKPKDGRALKCYAHILPAKD
ncbi:hypothetical protein GOV06_02135 [Candidatus Woesearchaeota archaeon]|nr:hypothetical protein [Candidatus Woesearchaeota archaeon]